jgi:hypothetical protein
MTLSPRVAMLSRIDFSIQSRAVKTDIMEKMPMLMPKSDRNVLRRLTITELTANKRLSLNSLRNIVLII